MEDAFKVRMGAEGEWKNSTCRIKSGQLLILSEGTQETSLDFETLKGVVKGEDRSLFVEFEGKKVELKHDSTEEVQIWFEAIRSILNERKEVEGAEGGVEEGSKTSLEGEKIVPDFERPVTLKSFAEFEVKIDLHPNLAVAPGLAYVKNSISRKILKDTACFQSFGLEFPNRASRSELPVQIDPARLRFNFWSLAKKFIGMDLTKVNVPAVIAEPISGLPKSVCWVQNANSLDFAATCEDPFLRMGYILGVFLMHSGQISHRNKKPFNPLLGETFEYLNDNARLVCEQICHHPPINAYHFESRTMVIQGTFETNIHMTMTGPAIKLTIPREMKIKHSGEEFFMTSPDMKVHNIIFGTPYFWLHDKYELTSSLGNKAVLHFSPKNKNPEKDFECKGQILDAEGNVRLILHGHWDKELWARDPLSGKETLLARKAPLRKDAELHHFFDEWSTNAGHLSAELAALLPPTDSRFRTDVRAFEHGDLEMTEKEKLRLEEKQRARRKINEKMGIKWKPLWFDAVEGGKLTHRFNGKYWKVRAESKWPRQILDLFSEEPLLEFD